MLKAKTSEQFKSHMSAYTKQKWLENEMQSGKVIINLVKKSFPKRRTPQMEMPNPESH